MYTTQTRDWGEFLTKAKRATSPVRVVRYAKIAPVRQGIAIVMSPVVIDQFTAHYNDSQMGVVEVIYQQTFSADVNGTIDSSRSHLLDLQNENVPLQFMDRAQD